MKRDGKRKRSAPLPIPENETDRQRALRLQAEWLLAQARAQGIEVD